MNKTVSMIALALALTACQDEPADDAVAPTPEPTFNKEFDLQGIHFAVRASSNGSLNTLTITPSGLAAVNDIITREIDGTVTDAEVGDINADGSPEVYVWVNSAGSGSYATPIGYSANNKRSLSEIYFPPISGDPINSKGYMGHDELEVVEGVVAHRFPLYREGDSNANPTGKTRQLQYKLAAGEAGWIMKLDRVIEY